MKTFRPTVKIYGDRTKTRKSDGRFPLFIIVNWKQTRAKESTGIYVNEEEFSSFKITDEMKKRIGEIRDSSERLLEKSEKILKRKGIRYRFTARDILEYKPKPVEEVEEESEGYKVYIHILPNNSIYIGQTKGKLEDRWCNGEGYKENKLFYLNIKKYGWENIKHLLYKENLTETEADIIEKDLIRFYSNNEIATGRLVLNLTHNNKKKPPMRAV